MIAFRGNYTAKIDEAGRLKLPGPFKDLLDEAQITQFFITSTNGASAQIWPLPEWEKQEARLSEFSTMDEAVDKYLDLTSFYGQQVKMDTQARVVLPPILRTAANLLATEEVAVRGKIDHIEVDNMQKLLAGLPALTSDDRKSLAPILRARVNS
jgi:MraZ protein